MNDCIDLNVSGVSKMPGGVYGNVEISGAGKIEGNLRCKSLEISGAGKVNGDVICDGDVEASGAAKLSGSLVCASLDASGSFSAEGGCTVSGLLDCSGSFRCDGPLSAQRADVSGVFHCAGDVSAEEFAGECACQIDGLLNAEEIRLYLVGDSKIHDIGGSRISIYEKKCGWPFGPRAGRLEVYTIEGDEIYLEATDADTVRGKKISIGHGCRIRRVEYSDTLSVDANALVPEKVKN